MRAPLTVTAELVKQQQTGELIVHLINYDVSRSPFVKDMQVSLRITDGKKVVRLSLLSPEEAQAQSLAHRVQEQRLVFTVPRLATYSLVVVELN